MKYFVVELDKDRQEYDSVVLAENAAKAAVEQDTTKVFNVVQVVSKISVGVFIEKAAAGPVMR